MILNCTKKTKIGEVHAVSNSSKPSEEILKIHKKFNVKIIDYGKSGLITDYIYSFGNKNQLYSMQNYLKWKDFLNQMSKGSVIDTEFETSIMTTKMITDIMQKGNRK